MNKMERYFLQEKIAVKVETEKQLEKLKAFCLKHKLGEGDTKEALKKDLELFFSMEDELDLFLVEDGIINAYREDILLMNRLGQYNCVPFEEVFGE